MTIMKVKFGTLVLLHVRIAGMKKPGMRLIVSSDIGNCLKHEPAGLTADCHSLGVY